VIDGGATLSYKWCRMKTLKFLPLLAICTLATAPLFAGDACCAHGAKEAKNDKEMCAASFAELNLTAEQKTQMEKITSECMEGGCTKESMAKAEQSAREVLTQEQFASWTASSCCSGNGEDKQAS
jgi:Spy/CpxP family protein refolding chaperone